MTRVRLGVASAGLALAVSGCPNPNTYTTPRTLDPGKVQWQLAPEFIAVNYDANYGSTDANGNPIKTNVTGVLPMLPTFGVRTGVAEGVEIGLRLPNHEPIAIDAKFRLLKGRLDVALDPSFQLYYASIDSNGFVAAWVHAPVLLGINFSEKVSLVLSPGLAYAANTASGVVPVAIAGASAAAGFMARLGVGVDVRVSRRLAVHPEITLVRQFTGSEDLLLCVGGIGFNFGAQPDYSDLASATQPTEPPEPPALPAPPAPAPPAAPVSPPGTPTEL
jgi:hypothetical protein